MDFRSKFGIRIKKCFFSKLGSCKSSMGSIIHGKTNDGMDFSRTSLLLYVSLPFGNPLFPPILHNLSIFKKYRMNHMPNEVLAELRALPGNNVHSKELCELGVCRLRRFPPPVGFCVLRHVHLLGVLGKTQRTRSLIIQGFSRTGPPEFCSLRADGFVDGRRDQSDAGWWQSIPAQLL